MMNIFCIISDYFMSKKLMAYAIFWCKKEGIYIIPSIFTTVLYNYDSLPVILALLLALALLLDSSGHKKSY
ncbi:MAG: hypothetical protein PF505_09340 [Vallitaleaceae bacterium]|nr:hypothetical protein [Vallitaleaceae bacterium]